MTLAFYKVENSKNFERHTFDNIYDKREEILRMLNQLKEDEWRAYDMNRREWNGSPNALDFEEDYNDEFLDGGWWCIAIPD